MLYVMKISMASLWLREYSTDGTRRCALFPDRFFWPQPHTCVQGVLAGRHSIDLCKYTKPASLIVAAGQKHARTEHTYRVLSLSFSSSHGLLRQRRIACAWWTVLAGGVSSHGRPWCLSNYLLLAGLIIANTLWFCPRKQGFETPSTGIVSSVAFSSSSWCSANLQNPAPR